MRLNELAEEEIARAHHGSLAREQRVIIEETLKAGRIPCLVATSQPRARDRHGRRRPRDPGREPEVGRARPAAVGRAGHELGSTSKGRIFPKFRADLLESAVVARAMRGGEIEETKIPRNPLDVLAQQIVAIVADDEIEVAELHRLVRGAYPFSDLSRPQLENVLDMLAGRYPSDEFAELRPRIVWDRTAGVIRGRTGARRLAVTNAGTIPDRGLFGVYLVGGGGRVGELDEEMVYEARQGQTFMLGASTWRIEEITRDRVIVSPAPGVPGAVPFWKGEGVGRPFELGEKIGARVARARCSPTRAPWRASATIPPRPARRAEPPHVPARAGGGDGRRPLRPLDRRRALPRRDRRLARLHPDAVRRPGARAVGDGARGAPPRLDRARRPVDLVGRRDRAPPARGGRAAGLADLLIGPDEIEELVVGEVGQTALFGARFRENAARALLIPRRRPGQRTPLWQQRLKAQNLLQVARKYGSFPIVLETYRECLQDVFDLPALKGILTGLQTRELDLVEVETASASPFASSLLFDYVATYMYEDDTPPAERRAQALSLDRDLLRELLGQEELRELIDPDALAEVEKQLRGEPRDPTSSTTCSAAAATCARASTTRGRRRSCSPSAARCRCASRARSG